MHRNVHRLRKIPAACVRLVGRVYVALLHEAAAATPQSCVKNAAERSSLMFRDQKQKPDLSKFLSLRCESAAVMR